MVFSRRAARVADQPTQGQGGRRGRADLDRDLVGRAADAAALDLERRLDVVERALERDDRVGAGLLAAALERGVDDALGDRASCRRRRTLLISWVTSGEP